MKISKLEGSTEGKENFPPTKHSAIVRAVWSESKKDSKTSFRLPVEALIIKRRLNAP